MLHALLRGLGIGCLFAFLAATRPALAADPAGDAPWPTIHRDAQRSGHTPEFIAGPYERKWFRDLSDEMIATRVEGILAEGKCFVGTFAGRLHALDVATGKTRWTFQAGGPIGAPALYHQGRIIFGSDDGSVYCLLPSTGMLLWSYKAAGGVWVAPCGDGDRIYFGDRTGYFHAVSIETGQGLWNHRAEGMILTPASVAPDGRIVFGAEDMHVYCLDRDGKLLWKSAKLGGLSMRDHAPTIWKGLALLTTNPARDFHSAQGQSPALLTKVQKSLPMEAEDKVIFDKWGSYTMKLTPRRLRAEQEAVRRYLAENRPERTFYALDLKDGSEPWIAPILYTGGLHNPHSPATFDPGSGDLYLWAPTALSNYSAGVPGGAIAVAKLDRQTGLTVILWHTNGDKLGWAFDFAAPADETQSLSLMDGILLNTHQGIIGGMDLRSLRWHRIYIARDTYGGIFGPAVVPGSFDGADRAHAQGTLTVMPNEWHGPDRAIVSIGYRRFFWVVGSQVVCLGGPDTAATPTGGTKPPPPIERKVKPVVPGGNVAVGRVGRLDPSVPKPMVTVDQLRPYVEAKPPAPAETDETISRDVQHRLDAAVRELISENWAPLVVELGISHEERHFWRTSQTMQTVALALPHLSAQVQRDAIAYLDKLYAFGAPLDRPVHDNAGRRREPYDLGQTMREFASAIPRQPANIEDLYALWAYAACADRWPAVLAKIDAVERIFEADAARPLDFSHDERKEAPDAAEHLNAQIAGTLAAARLLERAGRKAPADAAMARLAELVSVRVHHEQADTRFVRITRNQAHSANIPRYVDLTPELTRMLADLGGGSLHRNLTALSEQLPVWYHAYGERMIGGENYISPPTLARGLFMALADGRVASTKDLAARLDQPWGKADLYYIEKLTALMRRVRPSMREHPSGLPVVP